MSENTALKCPCCGEDFRPAIQSRRVCGRCQTLCMEEQADGTLVPMLPEKPDKSRRYEVLGHPQGGSSFFYPGEIVSLEPEEKDPRIEAILASVMDYIPPAVYVDGECDVKRFIMPERPVVFTTESHNIMMNSVSVSYCGPYGEHLKSPVFSPENILPWNAAYPVTCPTCGKKVPPYAFCRECGARLTMRVECRRCGSLTNPGHTCEYCAAPLDPDLPALPGQNRIVKVECPSCGETVRRANFCEKCGRRLAIVCPFCDKRVLYEKFCSECGKPLKIPKHSQKTDSSERSKPTP